MRYQGEEEGEWRRPVSRARQISSKLGLIVKDKEDGSKKRRIIIDLKRSGGNNKGRAYRRAHHCSRGPVDAVAMLRKHARNRMQTKETDSQDRRLMELVMIDISDAYMHLAVAEEEEKGHCLAPALDDDHWLLFVALTLWLQDRTFDVEQGGSDGSEAGPVQSVVHRSTKACTRCTWMTALWALCADAYRCAEQACWPCILTTMAALGLKLSLGKRSPGSRQ